MHNTYAGKVRISILEKAKQMRGDIENFLCNYHPSYSTPLPKIGDNIISGFVDTTKGITEDERDQLTSYLCTFKEVNFSVEDIPSMLHHTISFIIGHSENKGITVFTMIIFPDQ